MLTEATLDIAIKEWNICIKKDRFRIYHGINGQQKYPGRKQKAVLDYVAPILKKVLHHLDKKGESLTAKAKSKTLRNIISHPDSYVAFGADVHSTYTLDDIPDGIKSHPNDSRFLKKVYHTSNFFIFIFILICIILS